MVYDAKHIILLRIYVVTKNTISMKKILLLGMLSVFLFSCKNDNKVEHVERAFYYWKSDGSFDADTRKNLNNTKVTKLYVKYFEVDYSETMGNFPYDKTNIDRYSVDNFIDLKIVPTVFIKNEIFQFNQFKDLDRLADNIVFLVDKYNKEKLEKVTIENEIQIDCDWTKSTKDKYFYLLKKIKELSKREISCTLRLYPYKYSNIMGVPPVDKATLMCYNLIKPLTNKDKNSILDYDELKLYLDQKRTYPMHLDVALPVFYWTQLYHDNQFAGLIDLNTANIASFTKPIKPMWYEVTKDTTFGYSDYYRIGDQMKCEEVSTETINKAIALIKKNVSLDKNTTITLFHIDYGTFNKYKNEEISNFYDSFTK